MVMNDNYKIKELHYEKNICNIMPFLKSVAILINDK